MTCPYADSWNQLREDYQPEPEFVCRECGEPLAEGDEVTCAYCGATYTRE